MVNPASERMKLGFVCGRPEDVEVTRPLIHEDGEDAGVASEVGVDSDGGILPEADST